MQSLPTPLHDDGDNNRPVMTRYLREKLRKLAAYEWCQQPLRLYAGVRGELVEYEDDH